MTRINLVQPSELTDQHLLAEIRELPRVFSYVEKLQAQNKLDKLSIPLSFTLGTGHVKFFTNKLEWLYKRYISLCQESKARGFKTSYSSATLAYKMAFLPSYVKGSYAPTAMEMNLSLDRLQEKYKMKPSFYKHHSKPCNDITYAKRQLV